jgi:class 3 adenylate cyclase
MGIGDDLRTEVSGIFTGGKWDEEKANVVPTPDGLRLNSNHAKHIEQATVLYADIDSSTNMVDKYKWWFAAEVYKAYLRCAAQIIRSQDGVITAYDGDRVMAVFAGERHRSRAVTSALRINWAVIEIINPAIKAKYTTTDFVLKHVIGVDTSNLSVARVGIHNNNDLVWVGKAANHAAKLCAVKPKTVWITKPVYDGMADNVKLSGDTNMWSPFLWTEFDGRQIYGSDYRWGP